MFEVFVSDREERGGSLLRVDFYRRALFWCFPKVAFSDLSDVDLSDVDLSSDVDVGRILPERCHGGLTRGEHWAAVTVTVTRNIEVLLR